MDSENTSGGQNDWVEIQSPSSTNKAQWFNNENSVVIKDSFFSDDCAIFPPNNHEDLPIPNQDQLNEVQQQQPLFHSLSSSASSSSDSDVEGANSEANVEENKAAGSWIRMRLGFLTFGIEKFVSQMTKSRAVFRNSNIWSFASATTTAGLGVVVLVVLYYSLYRRAKRWKWRQVLQPESKHHHLMLLIKEKDQKINQLVIQIAQLNDMLLFRRRVPVIQVA
ncbi:hypothetical protein ACH5RR_035908 [Cinchona calisaya]|uniref:Transmembrane protein n=1 Tax=Cinchona calisaya TaxID=153742 RepID=A0ABD2Y567_9GENT